ncbi:MAG: hypothetical protein R3C10_17330 [Pirellulales bacterium]|nr:phenylacetate--CoA ligase family protein [Planctomycetales bacterium]
MLRFINAWVVYPLAQYREGRDILSKVRQLRQQARQSFTERRRLRQRQLANVLEHAGEEVPYYRDLFRRLRFHPTKLLRDTRHLEDLPVLTKDIIREQGDRLISQRAKRGVLHARKTGGSTGPSAVVYYSPAALDWTAAVNRAALESVGQRRWHREMHLASRYPEEFPWQARLREWFKTQALNRTNVFTDHFDDHAMETLWRKLRRTRPRLVQCHPSTMFALASYVARQGHPAHNVLSVFESTGEVLTDRQRDLIEATFACRAINRYGSAEFGVLAYEQLAETRRRLHLLDAVAWPEVIEHESGSSEIVLTGLLNEAMPLVRYRTGDLAQLGEDETGWHIWELQGRIHDLVYIGDAAYPTHYLQDVFDRLGGIEEFQFQQQAEGRLTVRMVVPDVTRHAPISAQLRAWWGDGVRVEFCDFDGLRRTGWRGKFRHLVDASDEDKRAA